MSKHFFLALIVLLFVSIGGPMVARAAASQMLMQLEQIGEERVDRTLSQSH